MMPALLTKAANSMIEGIIISNAQQPDNPIIYVNDGFVRLTGYSQSEAIGRNFVFLQGPDNSSPAAMDLQRAIRDGRECRVDLLTYRKDGSQFWNRLSITPIRDKDGRGVNLFSVLCDITELKEMREKLTQATRNCGITRMN